MKPLTDAHTESRSNGDASPDAVAEGQDSIRRMLRMLSELPDNQQEVVRLKYHHDMSYRQISEITNLTVSNVGYLIHTAIATLRRRFETPTTLAVEAGRSQS